jgi:hypothetical protein
MGTGGVRSFPESGDQMFIAIRVANKPSDKDWAGCDRLELYLILLKDLRTTGTRLFP